MVIVPDAMSQLELKQFFILWWAGVAFFRLIFHVTPKVKQSSIWLFALVKTQIHSSYFIWLCSKQFQPKKYI